MNADFKRILLLALLSRLAIASFMIICSLPRIFLNIQVDPGSDVLQFPLGERTVFTTLLEPFTRWDSARLLSVAHYGRDRDGDEVYREQAHAFLPFYPLAIGSLQRVLPFPLTRLDEKELAVLSGLILSFLSFVIAVGALYDLTYTIMRVHRPADAAAMAKNVALLFILNPSNVFFTTVYTESIFSCLTFCGYALWARGDSLSRNRRWLNQLQLQLMAVIFWIMAGYTRSNGTAAAVYILLSCLGSIVGKIRNMDTVRKSYTLLRTVFYGASTLLWHISLAIFVSLPLAYHDHAGYISHCSKQIQECQEKGLVTNDFQKINPVCPSDTGKWYWPLPQPIPFHLIFPVKSKFSFYSHVQRQHWNVGPFRYYKVKQIPNFVLAIPMLVIGFYACWCWCALSVRRWKQYQPNNRYVLWRYWYRWVFHALASSSFISGTSSSDYPCRSDDDTKYGHFNKVFSNCPYLSSQMLSHYAILFATCFVGALISHVQITTRLACSSCPALYWFLAACLTDWFCVGEREQAFILRSDKRTMYQTLLWVYLIVFNVLGCFMHVNWLPWT